MKILINGAGIAGPTLAWWLARAGHDITMVEKAPALRTGGYVIDFWGSGYDIAERMGLLPELLAAGYQVKQVRYVDASGRTEGGFDVDVFARATQNRFTSIRRSDLALIIARALKGRVEMLFGDSVAAVEDCRDHVHVHFDRAAARDFDLVFGADGQHSRVRELAFGPEHEFEVPLGYHVAAFEVEGYRPRDELEYVSYNLPGREISRFALRENSTLFFCMFRNIYLPGGNLPVDISTDERKRIVRSIFGSVGWESAQIMAAMSDVPEIYFDRVSQIRMPHWASGRIALVGDAGACVSLLAGEGTGLAMTEAYVLAAELAACGDHAAAFAAYEQRMMPFLLHKQRAATHFAASIIPKSALGIWFRNLVTRFLHVPAVANWFVTRNLRDDVVLPPMP